MSEWQPIETAPKDGSSIIVYRPNAKGGYMQRVGEDYWWRNKAWAHSNAASQPTHWQPMPEPPK